jgi:putative endonuclease
MEFYVYILFSKKLNRFYVGTTDNPHKRLSEHNSGAFDNAFTRKGIPWSFFLIIERLESKQAYKIENHIKNMKSKKFIENLLKYPMIISNLKLKYQ